MNAIKILRKRCFLAHHKATKKAIRTSAKRNLRNRTYKSKIKTVLKEFEQAESREEKEKKLRKAQQIMDRAAKRNVLKKNAVARKVSKLHKQLQETENQAEA
ncbi:MAG TPA: 30S ribosomal protein S20 [candidate division Zixibacteria bacterium]|nr:30S ribosomal protein S20 [candidate division Zixibacteria bacterium]